MIGKNILIILRSNFPFPLKEGGRQAVFHMIDNLRHEYNFSLLYFKEPNHEKFESELKQKWDNVKFYRFNNSVATHKIKNYLWVRRLVLSILNKIFSKNQNNSQILNFIEKEDINLELFDLINEIIVKEKITLIQTEFFEALNFVYALPKHVKKVFVNHEIKFICNERFFSKFSKTTFQEEYFLNKVKALEIAALNQYDKIITLTDIDKNILLENGVHKPISTSPALINNNNSFQTNYEFAKQIVFLGGYGHTPNYDGLLWFLENIWVPFSKKMPDVEFVIIGIWPNNIKNKLKSRFSNILFAGFVPNLNDYLSSSIMVIPLLVGSGMRMKIIEAVIHGTPFVSTSVGVEGLDFKDSIDCIIEDDIYKFENKLISLINDRQMQLELRENAFNTLQKLYSKEILLEKRKNIYNSL